MSSSPRPIPSASGTGRERCTSSRPATISSTRASPLAHDPGGPPVALPRSAHLSAGQEPAAGSRIHSAGHLPSSAAGKTLSVVNVVDLEAYVRGVVSSEMPPHWPLEAVKAQAVAARSFALSHRARRLLRPLSRHPRPGVRRHPRRDARRRSRQPPKRRSRCCSTAGKVATTFFFASSGGRTAALADVFSDSKPTPYLVSVPDPYDAASPYHTWGPVVVGGAVRPASSGSPASTISSRCPRSGRAKPVVAIGKNGEATVPAGDCPRRRSACARRGSASVCCRSHGPSGAPSAGASVTLTGKIEQLDGGHARAARRGVAATGRRARRHAAA